MGDLSAKDAYGQPPDLPDFGENSDFLIKFKEKTKKLSFLEVFKGKMVILLCDTFNNSNKPMDKITQILHMITNKYKFIDNSKKVGFITYKYPHRGRGLLLEFYPFSLKNKSRRPRFSGKHKFIVLK